MGQLLSAPAEGAKVAARALTPRDVRMSKKRSRGASPRSAHGVPGAVGGPSTGRGVNYQIHYAVLKALDLISRSLCVPHKGWAIRVEPRAGVGAGATQWDLGIEPPGSLV